MYIISATPSGAIVSTSGSDPRYKIPSLSLTQSEPEPMVKEVTSTLSRKVDDKCWELPEDESMSSYLFPSIDHKDLKTVSSVLQLQILHFSISIFLYFCFWYL